MYFIIYFEVIIFHCILYKLILPIIIASTGELSKKSINKHNALDLVMLNKTFFPNFGK